MSAQGGASSSDAAKKDSAKDAQSSTVASKITATSKLNGKPRQSLKRRMLKCFKHMLCALFVFMCILFGVLYYFLGTLSGARNALALSQRFIPDFIIIDTTIESGSVLSGLKLGHTLVDIRDVVAISADELTLDYDLSDITSMLVTVNNLEAHKLTVALSDKLFEGPSKEKQEPSTEPFRMSFPVDIDIHRFDVSDFAFRSQIVDVELSSLNSALWARSDKVGSKHLYVDGTTVHLKNEADVAEENADNEAVNRVDSSLAVMVDGQIIRLSDLDDASKALVAAAKQGKTVEMVIASEHNERQAEVAEDELFKDFNPATASATIDSPEELSAAKTTADKQASKDKSAAGDKSAAKGERKITIRPDSLVYKDPEEFAKAMESALFNEHKVPVLLSEKPSITRPQDTKPHKAKKDGVIRSHELTNVDDYEKALLKGINAYSNANNGAALNVDKNHSSASNASRSSMASNAASSSMAQNSKAAAPSNGVASNGKVMSEHERVMSIEASKQSISEQIHAQSEAAALNAADFIDAVTGATASTIAQQIRLEKSHKGEEVIAKHNAKLKKPHAAVKAFGSGDGSIEFLPSIVLPFDITVEKFKATKVRYYQEGFDTLSADIEADASWVGTELKVSKLNVDHVFGKVQAVGDLNFDKYFDLNFTLSGEGYKNDKTHDFLQGLLYGLSGEVSVEGDLTDLRLHSLLNLGGSSELNVHANVLSGALPVIIDLKTKDITYPIFGKPIVNAKKLDLHTAGNLADGIDLELKADISGYGFENVVTNIKSSIAYERAHIYTFKINGKYKNDDMMADITGDLFYGEVYGADLKAKGKISDLSFVSPMLAGSFSLDSDLVAILNRKENAPSALAVAGEPAYLANRIPKTSVKLEDFDADSLEARLLAEVKKSGVTGKAKVLKVANAVEKNTAKDGSQDPADDKARSVQRAKSSALMAFGAIDASEIADAEEALLSGNTEAAQALVATPAAVEAVSKGQSLAAVRPLARTTAWADGVADNPTDLLISQQEYVDAVRFIDEPNKIGSYTDSTGIASGVQAKPATMLEQIFSKDLPEVMANVRFIRGEVHLNGHKASFDIEDVVGDIHNGFRVDSLRVTQSENTVIASGKVAPNGADLSAVIDIKNLEYIYPKLLGGVSLFINSTGSLQDLNFEISGSAPRIKYGDTVLRKVILNAGFNTQTRALNLTALADRVRLTKALAANRNCFIDLSGTPLRHNLSASCGGASSAYVTVDGSLNFLDKLYTANLLELYLSTDKAGSISLETPVFADIDFGKVKGSVTPIELTGEIGKIHVAKTEFEKDNLKTSVQINDFDVSSLSVFMPEGMSMRVPLQASADVELINGKPNIDLRVDSADGYVFHEVGAGVVYDSFNLTSHIGQNIMHNTVNMKLRGGRGEIDSVLDIKNPATDAKLAGYFKIIDFDLETLSNVGRSFTELKGMVNLDSKIGGNLSSPLLVGNMTAKGSAVPRYDVGQVNDFDFKVGLNGQRGDLDGTIVLNGGSLKLDGDLDWSTGADGSLVAQAKKLPLFLVGYGTAVADINTKVTLGEVLDISGDVEINTARITVHDVAASGKSVSSDEILVPDDGSLSLMQKAREPQFKSTIDLGVKFGDDVRFAAMGMVKGNLAGGIDIYKKLEHKDIRSAGEIRVVDGTADVYGRKFNFATARVIFNGEIANPTLNVEVVADPESIEGDVVVGARVTGTAQAPDIKLFSKPSMSENEVLSYILYGHGLDKNVANQDSNNSNMILGLGVSGLSGLAQGVAGAFGVDNVQLGTQGRGDNTQVEVQGYVTRKLRLSYGYGVFNSVGEFKIRYELIRNLYAEFVSSIDQAVDIIYSFEFD
ncbi:translocation/assembly module TamB domain-containing protein [uncultured Anaerobiospirillum sp.]|uniref:translocation/assembly module TamB domain-containing protein n=1 Tax=uncultured Anaerobiospirillum sp. TaxID=265728 RepID=UPI002805DAF6|nr:translocation/assembly module TamB domain-containing protein [uncultured Anaerobiospirillum sp.]